MPQSRRIRGRPLAPISATVDEKAWLQKCAIGTDDAGVAQRARIVLCCLEGRTNLDVAEIEGVTPVTVSKWRRRFQAAGPSGLQDAPRSGGPRRIDDERIAEIVRLTLEASPPGADRWTTRLLGRRVGVSHATVGRIWREHQLTPKGMTPD